MSTQPSSPPSPPPEASAGPRGSRSLPPFFWRYLGIFLVGTLVGWFLLGWYLFPVQYIDAYPSDLRQENLDEYLIMVAESYAATHDLRTAAKRLRYWEPEALGPMIYRLAQSIERVEPERAAYLRLLAQDLHLQAIPPTPTAPPSSSRTPLSISPSSLIGLLAFLFLLGVAGKLAQRRGLLGAGRVTVPDEVFSGPRPSPAPTDIPYEDVPVHAMPAGPPSPPPPPPSSPAEPFPQQSEQAESLSQPAPSSPYEISPLPDKESIWAPSTSSSPVPEPRSASQESQEEEEPLWASESESWDEEPFTTIPSPPSEETSPSAPEPPAEETWQRIRFDGSPDFNEIYPIEEDSLLGQFIVGVGLTAPANPHQVIALEIFLYDQKDVRTTSALLAPPVLAHDAELLAQYLEEEKPVFPLQPQGTFRIETSYLTVEGRVKRMQLGPRTRDGVPVIEFAEIEFTTHHHQPL